jgi:hypothetical protein
MRLCSVVRMPFVEAQSKSGIPHWGFMVFTGLSLSTVSTRLCVEDPLKCPSADNTMFQMTANYRFIL